MQSEYLHQLPLIQLYRILISQVQCIANQRMANGDLIKSCNMLSKIFQIVRPKPNSFARVATLT